MLAQVHQDLTWIVPKWHVTVKFSCDNLWFEDMFINLTALYSPLDYQLFIQWYKICHSALKFEEKNGRGAKVHFAISSEKLANGVVHVKKLKWNKITVHEQINLERSYLNNPLCTCANMEFWSHAIARQWLLRRANYRTRVILLSERPDNRMTIYTIILLLRYNVTLLQVAITTVYFFPRKLLSRDRNPPIDELIE